MTVKGMSLEYMMRKTWIHGLLVGKSDLKPVRIELTLISEYAPEAYALTTRPELLASNDEDLDVQNLLGRR